MSKILKGNYILKKLCFGCGINGNYGKSFYNLNKKNFVYNKKDEVEEFGMLLKYLIKIINQFIRK